MPLKYTICDFYNTHCCVLESFIYTNDIVLSHSVSTFLMKLSLTLFLTFLLTAAQCVIERIHSSLIIPFPKFLLAPCDHCEHVKRSFVYMYPTDLSENESDLHPRSVIAVS